MAKNAKEIAVKGRQTKLQKKEKSDLIAIILKKDKVENNLRVQVSNLKGEVNALNDRVNNFDKDMEGTIKELHNYRDLCKTKQESIDSLRIKANGFEDKFKAEYKYNVELTEQLYACKRFAYIAAAVAVIYLLGWILF